MRPVAANTPRGSIPYGHELPNHDCELDQETGAGTCSQIVRYNAVSDAEGDMLKFDQFGETFSKPVYLPVFQTAGSTELAATFVVEQAIAPFGNVGLGDEVVLD